MHDNNHGAELASGGRPFGLRVWSVCALLVLQSAAALAQEPPPPPPAPSEGSFIGQTVTNPVTGLTTTVTDLMVDPAGTPTVGNTAFVKTADGYAFLVKDVGETIYNNDSPPLGFVILSADTTAHTVVLDADPPGGPTATLSTQQLDTELQAEFSGSDQPGEVTPPVIVDGASGVSRVLTGSGGSNGRAGALFVPPSSGGAGAAGPTLNYTNTTIISTTNQIGIEAGSIGGRGGNGGNSYLSFWDGRDGGNGGAGGTVNVTNATGIQVATTGNDKYGIFAFSRSGAAGNGGSGFAAPGGGTGGHSSDGGSVTVTNNGTIFTTGDAAFGIYGLSVSGNGGKGGDQWGLVGQSGSGGFGGSGGPVAITNNGLIQTTGLLAHGILAQSIGGSGGSSGTSGNLLVALNGAPDNGGNGGNVAVTNNGSIATTGAQSRGIFAQSIGGGGGSGGSAGGLIALGGAGSNGGSSGIVTVVNNSTGIITTTGLQSDGIFAQSVGGSGGSGSNAGGLVAVGGSGSKAGNGGAVTIENYGTIHTTQNLSRGLVAQSIGGGGGDGGSSGGMVAVGGSGAGGGNSATVTVKQGGNISTAGDDSSGIFAQSVGGGGGNGGSAGSFGLFAGVAVGGTGAGGGNGGDVNLTLQGRDADSASVISTDGTRSSGVFAQSVGGGGGNGGGSVQVSAGFGAAASVAVGGNGGKGGNGGIVTLSPGAGGTSVVETGGSDSTGVFLQSVGGGGGNGGYAVSVAASGGPIAGSLSVGIGGAGGTAGTGGTVRVGTFDLDGNLLSAGFNGSILTSGERSTGFFAQSVGGGGGNGGLAVSVPITGSEGFSGSIGVGVGGSGGGGGNGGVVQVGIGGNITTEAAHSTGMLVQSVGGGGGNGGGTISAGLSASGGGAGSITVGVGGDAGTGSSGGAVTVATRAGTIWTGGESSTGIVVQSVGGGGGNGGYTVSAGLAGAGAGAGAISVGLGGKGGGGGAGGTVDADLQSNVTTVGDSSTGILVQSVGGGGGNGGFNIAAGGSGAGTGSGAVAVGLGGNGGVAGNGGNVIAASTGAVHTLGDRSGALVVQSIGGGGGNGGFNVSGTLSGGGTGSGAVSVGLGGNGGGGGVAGTVEAESAGNVVTEGAMSAGILAQSVGGGGGNGGFNVSVALSGAGTGSGAIGVGLGGSGAPGGNGSTVDLTVNNDVTTLGLSSAGVIAQSVGGGGGNGGFNVTVAGSGAGTGSGAVGVGLGGSAAGGGDAARVTSTMTGNIATTGDDSSGFLAQSVGGGGGNGGFNVTAAISAAGTGSGGASVGLGGSGGTGGISGPVIAALTGNVTTAGRQSTGVIAQSLGGGGGNGGLSISGTIAAAGTGSGGASVGLGGAGGGGGGAGTVDNTVNGNVTTTMAGSGGVLAQSVGGGGGNGGLSISGTIAAAGTGTGAVSVGIGGSGGGGGDGEDVDNSVTGNVRTSGDDSFGVLAQSVGGGGGNGGTNISGSIGIAKSGAGAVAVGIGGAGGDGGFAGDVTNTVAGSVLTLGQRSTGVITQSLGGGGGNGGLNVSGTLTASKSASGGLAVGVGGFGGAGKDGGAATSSVTGAVETQGADSIGVLTQSVGGGGGNGGVNVSAAVNLSKENGGALGVGIGGFGGQGGNAGDVSSTVTTTAAGNVVATKGDNSVGVMAQSLGGAGGNGGVNVTGAVNVTGKSGAAIGIGVGGFGGGAGNGGDVVLDVTGNVLTQGHDAHGLVAQSLGGGGGNGGVNVTGALDIRKEGTGGVASIGVGGFGGGGGSAGTVDVTYGGILRAVPTGPEGAGSHGILAQSLGGGGGNGAVNVSAGLAFKSKENQGDGDALVVGVGGFGGAGGSAGAVTVDVLQGSSITSAGNDRSAIFAQSVGGGGGNGGLNVSGGIAADAPLVFGMGGFGGAAGTAGAVSVDAVADLSAAGKNARGIFAQSVGGGGGNGGLNVSGAISYNKGTTPPAITFGMGGFGGAGAISGDVHVAQSGTVSTNGQEGHGIFAQSLAGGGGNGGLNVSAAVILSDQQDSGGAKDLSIVGGIGGHGGAGADAGNVDVSSSGAITTAGDYARGVFAQSIGGGGGNGGINFTGSVAQKSSLVTLGVGGFGGGGGNAGNSSVTRGAPDAGAGTITTNGAGAIGIESTSIGGGGGDAGINLVAAVSLGDSSGGSDGGGSGGGSSGGSGGSTTRPHPKNTGVDPEVFTNYDKVLDELEGRQKPDKQDEQQQQQGKQDESGFAVQVAIGGAGGGAGNGGDASVANHGDVETLGEQSHGILAQSIGGGGGNAALNVALTYLKGDSVNRGLNFALGGATGDGGSGGTVTLEHDGNLVTHGADSFGLVAQSIGGGGGNASAFLNKAKGDVSKLDISIGRRGGSGGAGGDVSLSSAGSVATYGARSWGLLAQSIGNGGGNSTATTISGTVEGEKGTAARGASLSIGLEGGEGGAGGNVAIDASGFVGTAGVAAHGIFAQSVGGGGGNGGDSSASSANASISLGGSGGTGGSGGAVDIVTSAEVQTLGAGAHGVIAQSIGGGGGTGGKSDSEVESSEPGLAISLGGSGGTGSVGGAVTVANSGVIVTRGDEALGVYAQSLGGGGGDGGMSVTTLKTKKEEPTAAGGGTAQSGDQSKTLAQLAVNVGGTGGSGADGGAVAVTNTGVVNTVGRAASAIFAQSIGGGGGNASQVVSKFSGAGVKLTTGIGGTGGVGGTGGAVTVENLPSAGAEGGRIVTRGANAHGIVAMSIGGGGGNGSTVITEDDTEIQPPPSSSETPEATLGGGLSVGGRGGQGGAAGLVKVTNRGEIVTQGEGAHGILAQSIGGGGGNGGLTYTGAATPWPMTAAIDSSLSIGGVGGAGNTAGDVDVVNTGSIEVFGNRAYGVFAQSIGGGGGNGGFAATSPDAIVGTGEGSAALAPRAASSLDLAIGGEGGDGADSGNVRVDHTGSIVSHGNDSYGIFAQTIGGGGGTVGVSYTSPLGTALDLALPLILGSRDGGTGQAGTVTVDTEGSITMLGNNSHPYFVQSVNGGGGNANVTLDLRRSRIESGQVPTGPGEPAPTGFAAAVDLAIKIGSEAVENGIGSAIESKHFGDLVALGNNSAAASSQSIGGGGGSGLVDLLVNDESRVDLDLIVGGKNSTNSSAGDIDLARSGAVVTTGDVSGGTSVQSVGGGGGSVVVAVTTVPTVSGAASAASKSPTSTTAQRPASVVAAVGGAGAAAHVGLGSDGSVGNDGGEVRLLLDGDTRTDGAMSPGLLVQSIGAGGGDVRLRGLDSLNVRVGGTNGASGNGQDIVLRNFGDVTTRGALSHGVVLQSIGGGGGLVLTDLAESAVSWSARSDNHGSGGDITFRQSGDVGVLGDRAVGVLVQSIGGGGGAVDRVFMGAAGGAGAGGDVRIDLDGNVTADGAEGVAVVAQSAGSDGAGNVDVTLRSGHLIRGGRDGVGVWLSGAANEFANYGTVTTAAGVAGTAVRAAHGTTRVDNFGELTGQVELAGGVNTFTNHSGGTLVPGARIDLGDARSQFINDGVVRPGGSEHAQAVALNGSFVQSTGGTTYSEIDFRDNAADAILATGSVALGGTVDVRLVNIAAIPVGTFSKTLFRGDGGVVNNGATWRIAPSAVVTYAPSYAATTAALNYTVDFSPAGLGSNLSAVGKYINGVQLHGGGSSEYGELVTKLVGDPDMSTYRASLSQLSPEFYGSHQVELLNSGIDFGQTLLSCRQASGEHRFTREGSCVWAQYDSYERNANADGDFKSVDGKTTRYSVGVQKTRDNDWSFGFGLSREDDNAVGYADQWSSEGRTYHVGFAAKRRFGSSKWSNVLSYGWNEMASVRYGSLLGADFRTTMRRDIDLLAGTTRFAHDFEFSSWYVRLMIDGGIAKLMAHAAAEQGAGAAGLVFPGNDETHIWARPGVEVGKEFSVGAGSTLRLYANLGVQEYLSRSRTEVQAQLAGAPAGVDPMSVGIGVGDHQTRSALGLDLFTRNNFVAQFRLQGGVYDSNKIDSANLRFELPLR